jgi:endonuclease G
VLASTSAVGRLDVAEDVRAARWLGSAALVAPEVAVTAAPIAAGVDEVLGAGGTVRLSFGPTRLQAGSWAEVLRVAPGAAPGDGLGVLVVRLHAGADGSRPAALALLDDEPRADGWVVVVGCPPESGAADPARPVLAPKRLAPGARLPGGGHDAAVPAGGDGAAVLDVATGALVGVQIAPAAVGPVRGGWPMAGARAVLEAVRAAVPGAELTLELRKAEPPGAATRRASPADDASRATPAAPPVEDDRPSAAVLARRGGYDASFLGDGDRTVALPGIPTALAARLVAVDTAATGAQRFALAYEHFSIVVHADRRMALFTAGNIDGATAQRIKRAGDSWARDPRIPGETQWGEELYSGNDLDRGHLVRRLDPAWGPTATQGEADTFYYTNSCPQFHRFNDGIWGDLEDYLLEHASTLGFRATVFTGPVLADDDPIYRSAKIPLRFWKVAVMVNADRRRLSATGYLLDQTGMGTSFDFVFGGFGTSQVALSRLEALTGLDWSALRPFDPLDAAGGPVPLGDLAEIRL